MKTIQELYNEIMGSQELKAQFIEASTTGRQAEFLKEHDCQATAEEVLAFLKAREQGDSPLSENELENAAGGACNIKTVLEGVGSVISVGVGCAISAILSAAVGHVGQENDDEARTCTKE